MYDEFKANTSFLFEVDLSKSCIEVGSFNVQLSYKDDCGRKKKVNFKAVLPFAQLIKPEFIYEEQFVNAWNHMENEYYVKPKLLDFKNIRSHEDLKLILPFMEVPLCRIRSTNRIPTPSPTESCSATRSLQRPSC
jgi:hypothetical protein